LSSDDDWVVWRYLGITDRYTKVGVATSSFGHLILILALAFNIVLGPGRIKDQIVYSVTLEGGKSLGAISQVPKDKKSVMAPPKKAETPKKTTLQKKKAEDKKKIPEKAPEKAKEDKKAIPIKESKAKKEDNKNKKVEEKPVDLDQKLQQAVQRYTGESAAAGGSGFGAGRLGGEQLGGGVVRSPEFFAYKELLENYIKSGWRWYDPNAKLAAQIEFNLSPEGKIEEIKISGSSGVAEFDDSALRAVNKANPVPAPPESVYEFFKNVRITFEPGE